jgi:hypothetical protein
VTAAPAWAARSSCWQQRDASRGPLTSTATIAPSTGASGGGGNGSAFGSSIFLSGPAGTITFQPRAGQPQTVSKVIADQASSGGNGGHAGTYCLARTDGMPMLSQTCIRGHHDQPGHTAGRRRCQSWQQLGQGPPSAGNNTNLLVESAFTIASGTTLGFNCFNQTIGCSRMRAA